ncbi:recombinase RecJ [Halobacteriales archaeon QS_1_68_17]|nr:MAG: recombinase RecJ [Halobacteriales archaeon QS_1_68_17]
MDDWLIDDDRLPLGRKSVIPGEGFFLPDDIEREREETEAATALADAGTVVVADPDADGLACTALIREARGEGVLLPAGPREIRTALERVAEYAPPDIAVYVCDLCPDAESDVASLGAVAELASSVHWFDHHQWDDHLRTRVESAIDRLIVGDSEEECSADVALRSLDAAFDDRFRELATVTRDHDLWLREDPRSDDLADYAYWEDPEEYVAVVREHGADLPEAVREYLAEQRVEKEALIERAVDRAELHQVGPWTVGVTYGRCSQNEVAEALRQDGCDAAVIVKPAGSASLRGTDDFQRCHEVARQVNGGGHPKASGCKPDIYDDMLDYAHHWTTRGATAKQVILDAFRALDRSEDAEGTAE